MIPVWQVYVGGDTGHQEQQHAQDSQLRPRTPGPSTQAHQVLHQRLAALTY